MRYEGMIYRPPGEWKSWLLQCTVGCPHNRCTFCGMYRDKTFRVRSMQELEEDIRLAQDYYGPGLRRIFLCDGDALAMPTEQLVELLNRLYRAFPRLDKVTAYAGAKSALRKSPEELKQICDAGLKRTYLGVETGSGELLARIRKGVDREQMLQAGVRMREAGMDLWIMLLMGLAGAGADPEPHAKATADLVNRMRPRHVSVLSLELMEGTELERDIRSGAFAFASPEEVLRETRTLLAHITQGPIHFTSDHASNYLPLKGTIPDEAPTMIAAIDRGLSGKTALRPEWMRDI